MTKLNKYYGGPLDHFHRDEFFAPFDKLFDQFFNDNMSSFSKTFGGDFFQKGSYPKVDVVDYNDRVEVIAEIPGLTKNDVNVDFDVDSRLLSISGNRKSEVEDKSKNEEIGRYIHRELKHSSFRRSFSVGNEIDNEKISADFKNGTLKIALPKIKKEEVKEKKQKIKIL